MADKPFARSVEIPVEGNWLEGDFTLPADPLGVVIFAHGSGSSRHSPRNRFVAQELQKGRLGTLLLDLLTVEEEEEERFTRHHRFDIEMLASRLLASRRWLDRVLDAPLPVGYFGSSTGAAAALMAEAKGDRPVHAVVSRGGRPDLAGEWLPKVRAPTLLIVGGHDDVVIDLNREAAALLTGAKELRVIPGATHLFEEPGTLEQVAVLAREFFVERFADVQPHASPF